MSATRKQSEDIDRHNAAVMGLVAERDLLLAQQGELVDFISRFIANASLHEISRGTEHKHLFHEAKALLTKLGKS